MASKICFAKRGVLTSLAFGGATKLRAEKDPIASPCFSVQRLTAALNPRANVFQCMFN